MSQFLDTLKERFADAQRRLQIAQTRLQQIQAEHQAVTQEFVSWQNAINAESRREQLQESQRQLELQRQQFVQQRVQELNRHVEAPPATITTQSPTPAAPANPETPIAVQPESPADLGSKTDAIREVLRQHPEGITPVDVWKEVKDNVGRAYVYSVLKRFKDKKQVSVRRGKYFLLQVASTLEEDKENSTVH